MPAPPDQFQKKTYVRLPLADDYLRDENDRGVLAEIKRSFERPILHVTISDAHESHEERQEPGRNKRPTMTPKTTRSAAMPK